MESKDSACVISSPRSIASVVPFSNLVDILSGIYGSLHIITGNEGFRVLSDRKIVSGYSISYSPGRNLFSRILGHIFLELKIIRRMLQINSQINIYIFFMAEGIILPILLTKILRKSAILILAGSSIKILNNNRNIYSKPFELMEYISYRMANRIVIYSSRLIDDWGLTKYKYKIAIAHEHFLDLKINDIKKSLQERAESVGYIGRLSAEKGILNFVEAIPQILMKINRIVFLIVGDGQLKSEIQKYLTDNNLNDKVKLTGWIPHDDLPSYLSQLKLLVLPSYTEGLPNIMLEAMACGAPILTTKVGAIPDIIKDEETGFIMENNSPECIAKNVLRALNYPGLEHIAENGKSLVQKEFTLENATNGYRNIISSFK